MTCAILLCAYGLICPAAGQDARLAAAVPAIQESIRKSGADVGVAFRMLDGKTEWFYHADDAFHAASTMKVPVLIELFHQVREGKLKLDDPLLIKNEFHSLVDGSVYTLNAADDSEADLYKAVGQTRTLRQLSELMITVSSNFATNLLIEKLGVDNIRGDRAFVARGRDECSARGGGRQGVCKGMNNTTSARGLQQLMEAIARGEAVDQESSEADDRNPGTPNIQRMHPRWLAFWHSRGAQNRGDHENS